MPVIKHCSFSLIKNIVFGIFFLPLTSMTLCFLHLLLQSWLKKKKSLLICHTTNQCQSKLLELLLFFYSDCFYFDQIGKEKQKTKYKISFDLLNIFSVTMLFPRLQLLFHSFKILFNINNNHCPLCGHKYSRLYSYHPWYEQAFILKCVVQIVDIFQLFNYI